MSVWRMRIRFVLLVVFRSTPSSSHNKSSFRLFLCKYLDMYSVKFASVMYRNGFKSLVNRVYPKSSEPISFYTTDETLANQPLRRANQPLTRKQNKLLLSNDELHMFIKPVVLTHRQSILNSIIIHSHNCYDSIVYNSIYIVV